MILDPRLLNDLRFAESVDGKPNLTAYKDTEGLWTIGFGHLLQPQDDSCAGTIITETRAEVLLENDAKAALLQATHLPEWVDLDTPCRQNAVVEMVFNIGETKWCRFVRTRAAIEAKDWQTAHDQLIDSAWDAQVHNTRADRIANYLLTGEYP